MTEIFREVKPRKVQALAKLALYLFAFVWTTYRWGAARGKGGLVPSQGGCGKEGG